MKQYEIDIPVALIFFNRPEPLKEVFNAIKEAKPSKLFLIQDGKRSNRCDDVENINRCREIVDKVDWKCDVYKNYSDDNLGCGMRVFSGISWAFEIVDRLCIIEDDCVPSKDFFRFAKELLEKYKDDTRIDMISGMNNLITYDNTPYSYIFSKEGSIWGWATWKRTWETIDYNMDFILDEDAVRLLKNSIRPKRTAKKLLEMGLEKRKELDNGGQLSAWSYQRGMNMFLNSGLIIIPQKNLVSNIGLTSESVHTVASIKKVPKAEQQLYFMKTYKLDYPLTHPKYVIEDVEFKNKLNRITNPNIFIKISRAVERRIRNIIFK